MSRKVYNAETNSIVIERVVNVNFKSDDQAEQFVSILGKSNLENLLETQIAHENYEICTVINKYIKLKK